MITACMLSVIAVIIVFSLTVYYSDTRKISLSEIRLNFRSSFRASFMSSRPSPFQATRSDHPDHPGVVGRYHRLYPVNCSAVFHGNKTHLAEIRTMLKEQKRSHSHGDNGKALVPSDNEVSRRIIPILFIIHQILLTF